MLRSSGSTRAHSQQVSCLPFHAHALVNAEAAVW
jgi:hypothetical protein